MSAKTRLELAAEELAGAVAAEGLGWKRSLRMVRRALLAKLLDQYGGNQCRTAQQMGVHRNLVNRELKTLGIRVVNGQVVRR